MPKGFLSGVATGFGGAASRFFSKDTGLSTVADLSRVKYSFDAFLPKDVVRWGDSTFYGGTGFAIV